MRPTALAAAILLSALSAIPSAAQVDPAVYQDPQSLVGTWRPLGANVANPTFVFSCPDDMPGMECARRSGAFPAETFLRIGLGPEGALLMISNDGLYATIGLAPKNPHGPHARTGRRTFPVTLAGGETGSIVFGGVGDHCAEAEGAIPPRLCFDVVGMPEGADLADGTYEEAAYFGSIDRPQGLGDNFTVLPDGFQSVLGCVDITRVDPADLSGIGCGATAAGPALRSSPIFVGPNTPATKGSKAYRSYPYAGRNVAVPIGWYYVGIGKAFGSSGSSIIQTGQDLMESTSASLGVNASVNLFFVTASVKHNEKTEAKVENMYENQQTVSHFGYFSSDFAVMLDKQNVALTPEFISDVNALVRSRQPDYAFFLERWGTHYVHAATFGQTGQLLTTFTSSQVSQMHSSGVDVSTAVSVGVSFDGMGASAGVDVDDAKAQSEKMHSLMGGEVGEWTCTGGSTCDGKQSSAGNAPPVLLDLRPISDLVGPPFFRNVAPAQLFETRKALAEHVAEYAFRAADPRDSSPAVQFAAVTNMTVRPALPGASLPASITIATGGASRTFTVDTTAQDGSKTIPLMKSDETWGIGWRPGQPIEVTAAAPPGYCADPAVVPAQGTDPAQPSATFTTDASGTITLGAFAPCANPLLPPPSYAKFGMDLEGWCRGQGFQSADNQSGQADGWRCQPGDVGMDLQALCGNVHGPMYTPVNDGGPDDWSCRAPSDLLGQLSFDFSPVAASALLLNRTVVAEP
jgi:hypothetical protein